MSVTTFLLVPHARGATCEELCAWPSHWPRRRGRARATFAEIEPGLRFSQLLPACALLPAEDVAVLERLAALERHRGVRTRLPLLAVRTALEDTRAVLAQPRLSVVCKWLHIHRACATEVIVDVHCNTSGIYDDDFDM